VAPEITWPAWAEASRRESGGTGGADASIIGVIDAEGREDEAVESGAVLDAESNARAMHLNTILHEVRRSVGISAKTVCAL
jgi:hypothetical protein